MSITVSQSKINNHSMASDDNIIDITKLLFVLKKEEELIIKPFHSSKIIYKI